VVALPAHCLAALQLFAKQPSFQCKSGQQAQPLTLLASNSCPSCRPARSVVPPQGPASLSLRCSPSTIPAHQSSTSRLSSMPL